VVTCQNGAVPFSDKIPYFPTDLQKTQSSEIMRYLPTVMYGILDNSRNHSLNGQQFKTHWTDTITSPKFGPLAQNSFWYCPYFVCHFLFHFLRIEILELTVTNHLWTYLHLNVWNKFHEHACATVIQPKAGVLNFLLCHGTLWEFGENY